MSSCRVLNTFVLLCWVVTSSVVSAATNEHQSQATTTGTVSVAAVLTNVLVEQEYAQLQAREEAAQQEIAQWIKDKAPGEDLEHREHERLEPIGKAYADFVARHPNHIRARLDYGSFLNDLHDRAGARAQWEKVLELEPQNADAFNSLAGVYSAIGPAQKSFEYYTKAIQLAPTAAAYHHNFGDTIYVLRQAAMQYYKSTEQEVYVRALALYSNAVRLEPGNFSYGYDFAQTYYVIKPLPVEVALQSWTNTLLSARDGVERESVLIHLARLKMLAGNTKDARKQLDAVTNSHHAELKARLLRSIEEREKEASGTNVQPNQAKE